MIAFVDTNVIVRHLVGDPPDQARRATELLAAGHTLLLADLIVAEVAYVLLSVYAVSRATVASRLRSVVASPRLTVTDQPLLLRTIELFESGGLAFADAYLVASAERSGVGTVASFDRGLDRHGTVQRVEP